MIEKLFEKHLTTILYPVQKICPSKKTASMPKTTKPTKILGQKMWYRIYSITISIIYSSYDIPPRCGGLRENL